MPLDTSAVGLSLTPYRAEVDARFLMAYAAGLGHSESHYFDTSSEDGILNHPMFPIAPEWGLLTSPDAGMERLGLTASEAVRGVHAHHDMQVHRSIPAGTTATVTAKVIGAVRTKAGALMSLRFDGADPDGALWTTWMGSMYRGVDVIGDGALVEAPPARPPGAQHDEGWSTSIDIATWAPHAYSECSRIWNPIHTDLAVARKAGLDTVILHGSASLAHGVDWAMTVAGARPDQVRRIGASFRATVPVPSRIRPVVHAIDEVDDAQVVHFSVLNHAGEAAVRDAFVVIGAGRS